MSLEFRYGGLICNLLHNDGYKAFIVGGATRNFILNIPIGDIDICTDAIPEEIKKAFKDYKTVLVGEKFGTVVVIIEGEQYEVTTFRSERDYTDKRHPDKVVWETDINKDLSRRDFTMNSIAYDIVTNIFIDPYNGMQDIKDERIKAVGNPDERFNEDALRMLRACRFAGKLNFLIADETFQSIRWNHSLISEISVERIRDELLKILETKNPYLALEYMIQTRLLEDILPEVYKLKDIVQPSQFHKYTVMYHLFETVRALPKEKPLLRFAGLLHDIGKIQICPNPPPYFPAHAVESERLVKPILERLKFSNEDAEYIRYLVATHMDFYNAINNEHTKKTGRRFLANHRLDLIDDLFILNRADIKASGTERPSHLEEVDEFESFLTQILNEKPPLSKADLVMKGNQLMELGISPSPKLGKILDILLQEVIEDPIRNNKEYLLKRVIDLNNTLL